MNYDVTQLQPIMTSCNYNEADLPIIIIKHNIYNNNIKIV